LTLESEIEVAVTTLFSYPVNKTSNNNLQTDTEQIYKPFLDSY